MEAVTSNQQEEFYENEHVKFWKEDGIVINAYKPHFTHMNLETAKQIVDARHQHMTKGKPHLGIVETNNLVSVDQEAREYLANPYASRDLLACAIIVKSPIMQLAANIYSLIDRPSVPTKTFVNHDKAKKWLERFD